MYTETTNSQPPSKFENLKKVTPLSKYLALALFIALPFLGCYIGYVYAPQKVVETGKIVLIEGTVSDDKVTNTQPANPLDEYVSVYLGEDSSTLSRGRLHIDRGLGISFEIPTDWTVDPPSSTSQGSIVIKSPDLELGEKLTDQPIMTGTQIVIMTEPLEGKYNESLWNPETYLAWEERWKVDCSNCIMHERINFGGQVGLLSVIEYVRESLDGPAGGIYVVISLIHEDQVYNIQYSAASNSIRYKEVLKRFVETFEFI